VTVVASGLLSGVVAESAAMRELLPLVLRLADTRSPVLLEGESGTGKDLVAHWLHYGGGRREGPFLKVHCPSIPAELLESELFGHERGAFTDARAAKLGKIEMAASGTLYFDQVQDLAPALQAKLLRVVEERRFERVGGTRTIEVDVRFVASANLALADAVRAGRFREDLFHRLNVVRLALEPLRARVADLLPLAAAFLARERERGTTASRWNRSSRKRPSRTASPRSTFDEATKRTSTSIVRVPPTRSKRRSSTTRRSFACSGGARSCTWSK
jgi:two-component system NtrC family response regulator